MIQVTRTFLPPRQEWLDLVDQAWASAQLTNNGPLAQRLELELEPWHGAKPLFVSNGTIALQLAIRALEVEGEVITTPFSYVASTTAIIWEGCSPVMADIDPGTFCIDPARIEERITARTTAILATHVYGLPCDVAAIEEIARRHGLKVIYDGAHAFGTELHGKPLLSFGDAATCSFHATKIFHTAEGGSLRLSDPGRHERARLLRQFGHVFDEHFLPGINGKASELNAAMGLAVLPHMPDILERRRALWARYRERLAGAPVRLAHVPPGTRYNHSYFPVVLPSEGALLKVRDALLAEGIAPRRYFYPALSTLPYVRQHGSCPVAEDIAPRVLCLPLYHDLDERDQDRITGLLIANLRDR
ncbi:MAG: DegT/DnrJ/EryC1/StrS family aminotransferase [Flavobacteriales bacterium]